MEPVSEFVKRALQEKLKEKAGSTSPEAETVGSPAPAVEFPTEPFQCPACGQLLAPACRVCVACKHPIDPAQIARPQAVALAAAHAPSTEPRPEPVRFSWPIFFAVLGVSFFLGLIYSAAIYKGLVKEEQAQLTLHAAPILAGIWVFFDALRRRIPRPLRWAVGTMLLLIVVLPWYLARRGTPQSPVPFIEREVGPVTRFVLFALLVFFLVSLIYYIVQGPGPATAPASQPKLQKTGGSTPSRITNLHYGEDEGRG